jgi:hypothetical protein
VTCDVGLRHPAATDPSGLVTFGTASNLPTIKARPLSVLSHGSGRSKDGRLGGVPDVTDQALRERPLFVTTAPTASAARTDLLQPATARVAVDE